MTPTDEALLDAYHKSKPGPDESHPYPTGLRAVAKLASEVAETRAAYWKAMHDVMTSDPWSSATKAARAASEEALAKLTALGAEP